MLKRLEKIQNELKLSTCQKLYILLLIQIGKDGEFLVLNTQELCASNK